MLPSPQHLATVAALAIALAACGGSSRDQAPTLGPARPAPEPIVIPADATITIGLSAALTGPQGAIGADIADAAELAIAEFGGNAKGHTLHLARRDDGCTDPQQAVDAAEELLREDTLAGVVGPMCTTGAIAADGLYEEARVVHIASSATRAELSVPGERYFFRTAWRDDVQARLQARYALEELDAATAVVIDDGEPFGRLLAETFVAAFEEGGGRVLSSERAERGSQDYSSLAAQVLSAAPDVAVFEGQNPEGALIVRELHEREFNGVFMGADGIFSPRDFIGQGGAATEGAIVSGGPLPDTSFVERFRTRTGREPKSPFVLQTYDAVTALLRAVTIVAVDRPDGSLVIDREKLAAAFRAQGFEGLTGPLRFDERGDRAGDTARELGLTFYRVVNGVFVPAQ